jgi:Anthranilate/para-aminobenzoate synthases component I
MSQKQDAVRLMNQLGKDGCPFFFMVDFLQQRPVVIPLGDLEAHGVRIEMGGFSNGKLCEGGKSVSVSSMGYSNKSYISQFDRVVSEIRKGNSFLVNLTCQTPISLNASLLDVFQQADARYKLLYQDRFVVFSPETFVKIEDGTISSFPMKGTIDAALPGACEAILSNAKEKAEHCTIVDLIRNDLSLVASNVRVKRFRYIDELFTDKGSLLQVSSEITGQLPDDYGAHMGDLLFRLLPAGSITGAPKKKTVEIILDAETYDRGYYSGVFGIFDGKNLDSAVMIRFIEKTPEGYVYKSGGGITAYSNPEDEYNEMLKKIYVPAHRNHLS